jgi:hypothetical protein
VNFIVDADIRNFFDSVSQDWLVRFVEHRIGDRRIVRLIRKWLRAGILEDGTVTVNETGTGQGSVISPLLANIYLHYVLASLRPGPVGPALATARGHWRHDHRPLRGRCRRRLRAGKDSVRQCGGKSLAF